MDKRCDKCEYAEQEHETIYSCHRFPPTPKQNDDGGDYDDFPYVVENQWCGEFSPKDAGPAQTDIDNIIKQMNGE